MKILFICSHRYHEIKKDLMLLNIGVDYIYDKNKFMQLFKLLKTINKNYNMIIIDGYRYGLFIAILYSKLKKTPLILRLRGSIWREIYSDSFTLLNIFDRFIIKLLNNILNNVNAIIVVSHFLKEEVINFTKSNPDKLFVVYPSVNFTLFNPSSAKRNKGINTLISITNFNYYNKIEMLLEYKTVFKKLKDEHGVSIYILGDGKYLNYIRKIFEKEQITVTFTGFIKNVKDYLSQADIYFHLSKLDTFGISIIEAQAMGLPVVAFPHGGVPETFLDGETGFLVKNKIEFEEKIIYLLNNPDSRIAMGKKGRNRCLKIFNPLKISKQYYRIIYKVARWNI